MNHRSTSPRSTTLRSPVGLVALTLSLFMAVACGAPGSTPAPSPDPSLSPSPTPSPGLTTQVGSAAQAAALVFASDARFARMQPLVPDLIGQSAWYEASEDADGYAVTITFGAGDCQAGCIERHTWAYHVAHDGTITLVGESGDDIAPPPAAGTPDPITLHVSLRSGPTCPVVTNPPDPSCAERPVVNAEVVVYDAHGQQVASGTSAEDGSVTMQLPDGAYYVVAQEVEGLMGQAGPQAFAAVGGDSVGLLFSYDTGIR
jgi:hypothetical protein